MGFFKEWMVRSVICSKEKLGLERMHYPILRGDAFFLQKGHWGYADKLNCHIKDNGEKVCFMLTALKEAKRMGETKIPPNLALTAFLDVHSARSCSWKRVEPPMYR